MVEFIEAMWTLASQKDPQGIWFFAALYAFLILLASCIYQVKLNYWKTTQGQLVGLSVDNFGAKDAVVANRSYHTKACYEYWVDGQKYVGKRLSPWVFVTSHNVKKILERQVSSLVVSSDGGVTVFYNPRNPKKSYLIITGPKSILLTVFLAVLPFVLFYFKYYH